MTIGTAGKLETDPNGHIIQCFAPNRLQSVTAAGAWSPAPEDRIIRVGEDCTYVFTGQSGPAILKAGWLLALKQGVDYTFDTTMVLEVQ